MAEETKTEKKTSKWGKFLWDVLDRFMFIAIGALGTIATTYITGILKLNPPELVVKQAYNRIDAGAVAGQVGGLKLDYEADRSPGYGVLRVDIANEGRGVAEDVRFQVKLPADLEIEYDALPDFKVYKPTTISLEKGEFYAEMPNFPSGASDWIALRVIGDENLLCDSRIKLVSEEYEGEIEELRGVEGCR